MFSFIVTPIDAINRSYVTYLYMTTRGDFTEEVHYLVTILEEALEYNDLHVVIRGFDGESNLKKIYTNPFVDFLITKM